MLTSSIDRYLELRRALGYKLKTTECLLRSFARYAAPLGHTHISAASSLAWASQSSTPPQRAKRLIVLVGFARFLHAEDPRHEVPPRTLICPPTPRRPPYILSPDEIQHLIEAATELPPRRSLRSLTFQTLFSLLAVTGVRISEALALHVGDFTNDGLMVRETKFRKSRLVPLHETSTAALTRYLARRQLLNPDTDRIFVSSRRTPVCYYTAWHTFRLLCDKVGIPQGCSTLLEVFHLAESFDASESGGVSVLGDSVRLIEAEDIVGEAA
jgi:integrase/recombinase XerD